MPPTPQDWKSLQGALKRAADALYPTTPTLPAFITTLNSTQFTLTNPKPRQSRIQSVGPQTLPPLAPLSGPRLSHRYPCPRALCPARAGQGGIFQPEAHRSCRAHNCHLTRQTPAYRGFSTASPRSRHRPPLAHPDDWWNAPPRATAQSHPQTGRGSPGNPSSTSLAAGPPEPICPTETSDAPHTAPCDRYQAPAPDGRLPRVSACVDPMRTPAENRPLRPVLRVEARRAQEGEGVGPAPRPAESSEGEGRMCTPDALRFVLAPL